MGQTQYQVDCQEMPSMSLRRLKSDCTPLLPNGKTRQQELHCLLTRKRRNKLLYLYNRKYTAVYLSELRNMQIPETWEKTSVSGKSHLHQPEKLFLVHKHIDYPEISTQQNRRKATQLWLREDSGHRLKR